MRVGMVSLRGGWVGGKDSGKPWKRTEWGQGKLRGTVSSVQRLGTAARRGVVTAWEGEAGLQDSDLQTTAVGVRSQKMERKSAWQARTAELGSFPPLSRQWDPVLAWTWTRFTEELNMSPIFNLVASSQGGGEGNGAERQWRAGTRVGLNKQSPFLVPTPQFTHQDGCTGNTPVRLMITTGPSHMLFPLPGMLLTLSCSWLIHIHPSDPTQPPFLLDILLLPDQVRALCYALTTKHCSS